ncbi:SMP-30/gluconolactonase/LRE family protein [Microvirga antarctica]|uniref:SMP-30/gluconolactonase/LRE family protein n=1 Tax=Microvirga antarctica TaxID=2819233 RepID=UPI001B30696C|nr:SMP-30/gluconolactonase/LRE family protein [Microvirga antarctica]
MTHPAVDMDAPRVAIASACVLGEGPVWDHRNGTLLFVDIKDPAIWRYHPESGKHTRTACPERVGFVALTQDPDIVIAGFKSGLVRFNLWGGEIQPLVSPEPDLPNNRINDGHVGPDGRLYFGTMDDDEKNPTGAFWRWDGKVLHRFRHNITITNGPAFSPDGRTIYTIDTLKRTIHAQDLGDGDPGEARLFVQLDESGGNPDGVCVDSDGHLWVCHWGGSRITRLAPDGSVERVVPMHTAQVTKCAFGGEDLASIYITTAAIGRDPHFDPMAGHLYCLQRSGIRGLKSNIFEG